METLQTHFANRQGRRACTRAVTPVLLFLLLAACSTQAAWAQTFTSLFSFAGQPNGHYPFAGVIIAEHGDLYGTLTNTQGEYGAVYELQHRGSGYTFNNLFTFDGYNGALPNAGVVFGPQGKLYGTTAVGGGRGGGIVFDLAPLSARCQTISCPWHIDLLHAFALGTDGSWPGYGNVTFDSAGNLYGTTADGGTNGYGQVFELIHSGGQWTKSTLYSFAGPPNDGSGPYAGVTFDAAGNMFGTTVGGGENNVGTIYKLIPTGQGWTESVLYSFSNASGDYPSDTLVIDSSGNLYGTTLNGGPGSAGTVFELSPSGGGWTYSVLYSFSNCDMYNGLAIDSAGVLYGACPHGGQYGSGMVYKLANSGGAWTLTDLYDFSDGVDGGFPEGTVTLDSSGNLFGTTEFGGTSDAGTVWELTGAAGLDAQSGKP